MSKLKQVENPIEWGLYYDKSEADKVIAEKNKVIAELEEKLIEQTTLRVWAELQLRRQKYRRCLDKARWCENRSDKLFEDTLSVRDLGFEPSDELTFKLAFFRKWHKRWLEFAEKFKEVK